MLGRVSSNAASIQEHEFKKKKIMKPQSGKRKSASGAVSPDVAGTDENSKRAKSADGPVIPGPVVVPRPETVAFYGASGDPLTIPIVDSMLTADGHDVKVAELMKHIAQERKTSRWGVVLYDTETPESPGGNEANGGEDLPFFEITATIPLADLCGEVPKRDLGFYILPIGVSPHFSGEAVTMGKLCLQRIAGTGVDVQYAGFTGTGVDVTKTRVCQFLRDGTNSVKPTLLDLAYIHGFRGRDIRAIRKDCAAINDLAVRQSRGYTLRSLALDTGIGFDSLNLPNDSDSLNLLNEYAEALCRDWGTPDCTLEKLHVHGPLPRPLLQQLAEKCPPAMQELEISWLTPMYTYEYAGDARARNLVGYYENHFADIWASRSSSPASARAADFLGFVKAFGKLISALPSRSIRKIVFLSMDCGDGDAVIDPPSVSQEVDAFTAEQVPTSALDDFASAFGHLEHLEVLHLGNILGSRLRQAVAKRVAAEPDYLPALEESCSVHIAGARAGVKLEEGPQWCHIEVGDAPTWLVGTRGRLDGW